jgi:hypothetical protein
MDDNNSSLKSGRIKSVAQCKRVLYMSIDPGKTILSENARINNIVNVT